MGNEVYIASDDNQINLVNTDRQIVITQPNCNTAVNVEQPITSVVEILTGPPGPAGVDGRNAFPFTGSAVISGSLIITGSSVTTLTASAGLFSGSGAELFNIPASAVVGLALNQITTGSVSASVNLGTNAFTVKSGSVTFLNITNQGAATITGSLTVSGSSTFTNIGPAVFSGSVNISGSGVLNGANILTDAITGSLVFTSSFNAFTASYRQDSASFDNRILSNSGSIALLSGSYLASSASFATRILNNSSSIASLSSSYLLSSASFDSRINIISSSYATTGSNTFVGNQTIQGNITVRGTASVDVLITNYESSSIIYSSGSTKFGDTLDDTHEFTGSLYITGSTVSLQGGSFSGSGANLFNIPASGITGLNLSQIATGSVSASVSLGTGSFTVSSGSSNFLFISSSGNIGIGTSTPSRLLHVNEGGTRLYQTFNPGVPTLYVYHGRTENDSTVRFENGSGDNLYFGGNGLFVTGNTNIGSGTTLLGARLGVRGSGATSSTTALLVQNSNASASLAVLDNGKVGIGTTTPGYQLSVVAPNANDGIVAYVGSSGMIITGNAGFGNPGITSTNGYIHVNATLNGTGGSEVLNVNKSANGAYIQAWRSFASSILTLVAGDGSIGIKTSTPSASLHVVGNTILSGSAGTGSALQVYKSGSTVVDVQGSQGQLFSIVDALSGSLMSVNDISGLPILEVFSDDRVVMGTYGAPGLTVTGSTVIASGSFSGSFFGNGGGLTNISASSIVGLNLYKLQQDQYRLQFQQGLDHLRLVLDLQTYYLFLAQVTSVLEPLLQAIN